MRHLIVIFLLFAAALVVRLSQKTDNLQLRIATLQERAYLPYPGYWVPTFTAVSLRGDSVTLGEAEPGTGQLLLVFNTSCPYCLASLPAWRELTLIADTSSVLRLLVMGVSLDSANVTSLYVHEHDLPFDVVGFPAPKLVHLYRVSTVPRIVLLDHEGRVLYSRTGALEGRAGVDSVVQAVTGAMR